MATLGKVSLSLTDKKLMEMEIYDREKLVKYREATFDFDFSELASEGDAEILLTETAEILLTEVV